MTWGSKDLTLIESHYTPLIKNVSHSFWSDSLKFPRKAKRKKKLINPDINIAIGTQAKCTYQVMKIQTTLLARLLLRARNNIHFGQMHDELSTISQPAKP